jgi:WD40 repeat protein
VPYGIDDTDGFFGRDGEVEACLDRLTAVGVLAVVGPSGSGKSSLVRAGVAAALQHNGRRVVVISPGIHPIDALTALPASGPVPVLVVDQCEEAVTMCDDPAEQAAFFAALAAHAERAPLVIALRADRLGDVSAHPDFARLIEPGLHLLSAMSEADLRAAIEGPARQVGLLLEPGLVDLLVREVEGEPGALPLLSHALHQTWQRREGRTLTVDGYQQTGGIRGSVAQSAEAVYDQVPEEQRSLLRDLLLRLVTSTPEGEPVRNRVPRRTVATDAEHEGLVELLVRARLVTSDDNTVELAHESLARAWPRLRGWLDDDVEGQRILRHLAFTADTWDTMGRPDSELYRGVRLAQALDWQTSANPDLTPAERDFLDISAQRERAEAETTEQQLRHRTRQNRRLRALLAGAAVFLVVSFVAGLLAVRQADRADRATIAADARRVGAQALLVDDIDQSLLLAVEGVRLDDTIDTRANLLAALDRSPELIGSIRGEGTLVDASDDGDLVAVSGADRGLSLYDAAMSQRLGTLPDIGVSDFAFRPGHPQLAVAYAGLRSISGPMATAGGVLLFDVNALGKEAVLFRGIPDSDFDPVRVSFSADGGRLAVSGRLDTPGVITTAIGIWDLARPDEPVWRKNVEGVADVSLSTDGRRLYVGTADPAELAIYEVDSGRKLRSESIPAGTAEINSSGTLIAVANGPDVVLYDAATLSPSSTLRGHAESVGALRFSPDGALLASTSRDGDVFVWEVATGAIREDLALHADVVTDVAFGADGTALYTASDGALLVWDLAGDRRFITRHGEAAPDLVAHEAVGNPSGTIVAYLKAVAGDGQNPAAWVLQFRDLETGRLTEAIVAEQFHPSFVAEDVLTQVTSGDVWHPNIQQFATIDDDGLVHVWDATSASLVTERQVMPPAPEAAIDYTPDGENLVVAAVRGTSEARVAEGVATVFMLDAETLEPVGTPVNPAQLPVAVSAGPDGRVVIAVDREGRFAVVDLVDGKVLQEGVLSLQPSSVEISSDGQRAVVIGTNAEVGILDLEDGEWVSPPVRAPRESANFASYTADGERVVVGGRNGATSLWDGRTGQLLASISADTSEVVRPTILDDGYTAMLTAPDGSAFTWDTRPESWVATACAIAGRNLTDDEWRDAFGDRRYRLTCPEYDAPVS